MFVSSLHTNNPDARFSMNPFFNSQEFRPRALIRIILFLVGSGVIFGLRTVFQAHGFEYVLTGMFLFIFFAVFFKWVDRRKNIDEAGLTLSKKWWIEFGAGTLFGVLAIAAIFGIEYYSGDIEVLGFAWERVTSRFFGGLLVGYFLQMLSVGFYEEFISRSYLIPNIKEGVTFSSVSPKAATWIAILSSSALFGVGHLGNPEVSVFAIINIVGAGFMLALPYVLTGRLALSVGIHFSWNFFQGGIFGFRVSGIKPVRPLMDIHQGGNTLWTGGAFGPEGGAIGLLGIGLILSLTLIYIRLKEGNLLLHPHFKRTFQENQQTSVKPDELT